MNFKNCQHKNIFSKINFNKLCNNLANHLINLKIKTCTLTSSNICLVKNGFDYSPFWDASTKNDSIEGYKQAMKLFNKAMNIRKSVDDSVVAAEAVDGEEEGSTEAEKSAEAVDVISE